MTYDTRCIELIVAVRLEMSEYRLSNWDVDNSGSLFRILHDIK